LPLPLLMGNPPSSRKGQRQTFLALEGVLHDEAQVHRLWDRDTPSSALEQMKTQIVKHSSLRTDIIGLLQQGCSTMKPRAVALQQ
jgi:hypothetical protein